MAKLLVGLMATSLCAITLSACAAEEPIDEEVTASSDSALGSCAEWSMLAGTATAMTVTLAVATATCAGAMAVTGPGEAVCLLPAGTTTLAALTGLAAGLGVYLTCSNSGRRVTAEIQSPATTRTANCNPADLVASCSCAERDRRYRLQQDLCEEAGRCGSNASCDVIERVMTVSRNCINARRDVQRCYRRPDFDGHQTQINSQCLRFRACMAGAAACGNTISVPLLPTPCAY